MIIKGNNLIALHSLKQRYLGKVKMIYLDPPYYLMKQSRRMLLNITRISNFLRG
nr:hypothetical protein [Pediococcus inopinatus]